ncbi:MAG TPA: peptide ligase PGM1-related protein [Acidimicrobiia bacterium]
MAEQLEPLPGSAAELQRFADLQRRLPPMYRRLYSDPKEARTVVVVPSLSFDTAEMEKITGVLHYEERMLCLLMLLHLPRTHLVYVTSLKLDPAIVDYYLHLLPGVPTAHARKRLTLLSCDDARLTPLTQKVLERPDLLERLRTVVGDPATSHMSCFNTTALERTLAVQLGIPLYGCDPALNHLGSKSMSRRTFREANILLPDGYEEIRDRTKLAQALADLKARNPALRSAVVKLNDSFSGEGNALFSFDGLASDPRELADALPGHLRFEAANETWDHYEAKLGQMGGIVESLIEGAQVRSPSVQFRIDPLGEIHLVSTHDQVLGGPRGQVYLGCRFPADAAYRHELHEAGMEVARLLRRKGVLGRFAIDFVSVLGDDGWKHYALEINLRKGGTTIPYLTLEFLTNGDYDPDTGLYHTRTGQVRGYYATDNLTKREYVGLVPEELIDLMVFWDLHWDATSQQGVVFHLMGAVTEHGKLGLLAVAEDTESAERLYASTVATLDRATAASVTARAATPVPP